MSASDYQPVGVIARSLTDRLGVVVRPRDVTDLFYSRILQEDRCPILAGRRLIPVDLIPAIESKLRENGRIPASAGRAVI
jgi:hypothetical protein